VTRAVGPGPRGLNYPRLKLEGWRIKDQHITSIGPVETVEGAGIRYIIQEFQAAQRSVIGAMMAILGYRRFPVFVHL
jgi:hypothetical protein